MTRLTHRRSLLGLVVLAAAMTFSLSIFSRQSASAQRAAADAPWTGQKWEYKVYLWDNKDATKERKTHSAILNEHGAEGWEFVAVTSYTSNQDGSFYFKRPLAK
jgi:hypothetical protein